MFDIRPVINILLIFTVFAFLHSITVSNRFKALMIRILGERFVKGAYRLIFTFFSVIITAIAFSLIALQPNVGLRLELPIMIKLIFHVIQLIGLILIILPFKYINIFEFTGVSQFFSYIKGKEISGDLEGLNINGLITNGIYGYVRHPLYLGSFLIITFNPYLDINKIAFIIAADIYFIIGGLIEQRRMIKIFGDEYIEYQKKVPAFFPSFKSKGRRS
ncbi:MAG: isoprenylcysteine carboxylmethyltransferase family protein [Nitrospirae bacterium]|nr:isoprenylcysteine carboxylmethyltransferase family protein [Nitrospirota bacterium]MBF0541206.1 isoprenylcysteine carboxylmethyltransferase family protein [Nitrospirota bacterium]